MALKLKVNGTEYDMATNRLCNIKFLRGYSHPTMLTFTILQSQHTLPIPDRAFLIFTDDNYLSGDYDTPVFEGHVHAIIPGPNTDEIQYVAYDPTYRAAQEITIMNGDHSLSTVYPRVVFNVKIDNDDDLAFEIQHDATVQDLIETLLDNAQSELEDMNAGPVGGPSYVGSELTSLDYEPQDKVVFESESIRGGLDRLLSMYPNIRLLWIPGADGERLWHFIDVTTASQVTVTLNDSSITYPVLSCRLSRSLEGRVTAVKIYGPEQTEIGDVSVGDSTLNPLWNPSYNSGFETGGPSASPLYVDVSRIWQIDDVDKQHIANLLPGTYKVEGYSNDGGGTSFIAYVRGPLLLATWDAGTTWEPVAGITIDRNAGKIISPFHVYKYDPDAGNPYVLPDDVRFVFPYYIDPLTVRYPSSGYSGTAYSVANAEIEMRRYEEALSANYERYLIADQATREAEFLKLATSIHKGRKDIVYTGGLVFNGIDYSLLKLNKRINITAKNANGGSLTTGWESINAILTDVEYDYEEQLTTIQLSSDHSEYLQVDPEELMARLKLDALRREVPTFVVIEYKDPKTGRIIARFTTQSLNEEKYSRESDASKYDPNSPNYQGGK